MVISSIIYFNRKTGVKIALTGLSEELIDFYRAALRKFRGNASWTDFEEFAFGMKSPIYSLRSSHLEVVNDPLYQALKDMWLTIGVRQGLIAKDRTKENRTHAPRRSQSRRWQAANQRHGKDSRKLAAADSPAASHS